MSFNWHQSTAFTTGDLSIKVYRYELEAATRLVGPFGAPRQKRHRSSTMPWKRQLPCLAAMDANDATGLPQWSTCSISSRRPRFCATLAPSTTTCTCQLSTCHTARMVTVSGNSDDILPSRASSRQTSSKDLDDNDSHSIA